MNFLIGVEQIKLVHGIEYFGEITDIVLTDRMKTVIMSTGGNRKPIWNSIFEDLAATLGFTPKICRARRLQTKGKVEGGIDFVNSNFLSGKKFIDYGDLNRLAIV
ncbi:integrase-like protein [Thermosediminibacter litoriperuensis]|uniref:Integrase-like protein n=1 Tax=Thermosediminibacter litoriperuensis TaxID=291989 RepID=A0A5S5APU2_9FIRM|nr:integrase-like protein [Thermosediminibacter litoriperuensis]